MSDEPVARRVLSRDDVLNVKDLQIEPVDLPLWGGTVYVRGLTAAERDAFEAGTLVRRDDGTEERSSENLRARLVALAACNEMGARLFKDEDAAPLGAKHGAAVDKLFWVARRLSAFTDADLERLIANFKSAPAAVSSSA